MDILATLNPAQKQAVQATGGPMLILAGPGSGKTRVITHRIAYMVTSCGVAPYHIMALTFTNKAAREMRNRLELLLGQDSSGLTLGTFHAVCSRILHREGRSMGLDSRFSIYDEEDQVNVVKQVLQTLNLDAKKFPPQTLRAAISQAKSQLVDSEEYAQQVDSYFKEIVSRVYYQYQQRLGQVQAVDFDDLLVKTVKLFRDHPDILSRYQERYTHVLVDEFQDTNIAQYVLLKQLAGRNSDICVVGDPDQSIYSWRFADLRNIFSFEADYPQAQVVLLEQNYRSTKNILGVASDIISANVQRKTMHLRTENEEGPMVTIVENENEGEEAQRVVNEIQRLVDHESLSFRDCAVMYRVNAQSRVLEDYFVRYGMPYKLVGGVRFYQRREVKDVIAYLRVVNNRHDDVSLARIINIPGRGIGVKTLSLLRGYAQSEGISLYQALGRLLEQKEFSSHIAQSAMGFLSLMESLIARGHQLDLAHLIDEVIQQTGYREYLMGQEGGGDKWENVMELRSVALEYDELPPEEALAAMLDRVSLATELDGLDDRADVVTLITLHQAKGLEFPAVFITGMEEGLLPHRKAFLSLEEMEEERRLCYVGVTRAEKYLYLLRSYRRNLFGRSVANPPSRFLRDVSPHLANLVTARGLWQETKRRTSRPEPQLPAISEEWRVGEHVHHRKFGDGIVMNCLPENGDCIISVAFKEVGVKKLLLSLTPMEKIIPNFEYNDGDDSAEASDGQDVWS